MKIEKTSMIEMYSVETGKYYVSLKYQEDFNNGWSEWQILYIENKDGLEVILSNDKKNELKKGIVEKISDMEK